MRQAEKLRQTAARIGTAGGVERGSSAAPVVRQRPVRRTVDLPPTLHRELAQWCAEAAEELGLARVTGQEVLTALAARLVTDPDLSRVIREAISQSA